MESRLDRLFFRLGGGYHSIGGWGFGDAWEKEGKRAHYTWWIGSRAVYLWFRIGRGFAFRIPNGWPQVNFTRHALPRFARRPFCSLQGHELNKWVPVTDGMECFCGRDRASAQSLLYRHTREEN